MNPRDDDDDQLWASLQGALGPDVTREPPAERVAKVRADAEQHRRSATPIGARRGRRELLVGGIAASVGALAGVALSREDDPPDVPMEAVSFATVVPDGAAATANLIDHTWGLETILTATGLPADRTYRATYLLADDDEVEAGAFLGVADTTIVCRMNGPVRRDVVRAIEITDSDSGDLVLRADLA